MIIEIPIETAIRFVVPTPTSTNRLHSVGKGRKYASDDYVAWRTEAGREILAQRAKMSPKRLPDAAPYGFALGMNVDERGDIDNRVKASLDLLHTMSIVPDDRLCRLQVACISSTAPRGWVSLLVWRLAGNFQFEI